MSIGDDREFFDLMNGYYNAKGKDRDVFYNSIAIYVDSCEAENLSCRLVPSVLAELRADICELQNNLEAFGEYSQEAARVALDGALNALDECADRHAAQHQPVSQSIGDNAQFADFVKRIADSQRQGIGIVAAEKLYNDFAAFVDRWVSLEGNK